MQRLAIIAGTSGKAEFGHVEVPATLQQGAGEVETRPVGDFGAWHTAKKGTATMLYVVQGEWTVDGALCLNDIRQQAWKAQGLYPKCFLDKKGKPMKFKDCGSMKKNRSMLSTAFDKYGQGVP